jgi:hypothetical protein
MSIAEKLAALHEGMRRMRAIVAVTQRALDAGESDLEVLSSTALEAVGANMEEIEDELHALATETAEGAT